MKILITGDLVIDRAYDQSGISDDVVNLFEQADLKIVNLEAPVTNSVSKILKTGPHLKSHKESTLKVLELLGVDIITLANNHLLDYDELGILNTIEFCKENSIQTVGGGMNLEDASQILYINSTEGTIAIINFAENEWASATDDSAGANPMDIIANTNQIKNAKMNAAFVFVIVHGGHEYHKLPSPRMQEQYRFYADQGADIVIGHHTHCISGNEIHNGVPIYYSLGNFLFLGNSLNEGWYTGLVLEVEIKNGKLFTNLHPTRMCKQSFQLGLLNEVEKEHVTSEILLYNSIISDRLKLKQQWEIFVESKYESYLNYWSPISFISNRYLRAILNKIKIKGLNKKSAAYQLNLMRCESHSNISKEVIKKYLKK